MLPIQPGILAPLPAVGRYLSFQLSPGADPRPALARLAGQARGADAVVGIGPAVVARLGRAIEGLAELPALSGPGPSAPSTPVGVWCWLRGPDPGLLLHRGRALAADLRPAFALDEALGAFTHDGGRDLSGYEDGTENPQGDAALEAAFVAGRGPGLDGSSFLAVQRWVHDLDRLEAMSPQERDQVIGRRRGDNEELEDAPESAHVKRTAQESFDPPAFVLRRSMPWAEARGEGLVFVAFARSPAPFLTLLRRMLGLEDGVSDALFRFTRPLTGSSLWCPPLSPDGRLDLSALGM